MKTFGIAALNDAAADPGETVAAALAAPADSAVQLGTPDEAVVTIGDVAPPTPPGTPAPPTPIDAYKPAQLVVLGSITPGVVRVLHATTHVVLREFAPFAGYAGVVAVAAGDVTGDGVPDVVAATASDAGHVKVFDGATGSEVRSFLPFAGYAGGLLIAAGDVDGDGRADVVVGTATGSSHVVAISGRTGAVLHSFLAFPGYLGGVRVAAADVLGSGRADIVVTTNPGGNGHVKAFDGATGAEAVSFLGYAGYAGEINLAAGDINGDGKAEIVTVAHNAAGAHVKAFSGLSGALVRSYIAPQTATGFGGTGPAADSAAEVAVGDVRGPDRGGSAGQPAGGGFDPAGGSGRRDAPARPEPGGLRPAVRVRLPRPELSQRAAGYRIRPAGPADYRGAGLPGAGVDAVDLTLSHRGTLHVSVPACREDAAQEILGQVAVCGR